MPAHPELTPVVEALLILARRGREVRQAQQTAVSTVPLAGDVETAAGAACPQGTGATSLSPLTSICQRANGGEL